MGQMVLHAAQPQATGAGQLVAEVARMGITDERDGQRPQPWLQLRDGPPGRGTRLRPWGQRPWGQRPGGQRPGGQRPRDQLVQRHPGELRQTLHQALLAAPISQIAQMGRQPEAIAQCQSRRTLEIPRERQQGRARRQGRVSRRQGQGLGGIAPGPAQQQRPPLHHLQQRVIQGPGDRPVMHQIGIGDTGEPMARLERIDAEGFTAAIAAGGHQRPAQTLDQQVMQR